MLGDPCLTLCTEDILSLISKRVNAKDQEIFVNNHFRFITLFVVSMDEFTGMKSFDFFKSNSKCD